MKRLAALTLAVFTLTVTVPRAPADLLAPGSKWISHSVVIDNLKDHPDYAFFTYTTFQNHTAPIVDGKPLSKGNGNPINAIYVVGIPRDKLEALGGKPQDAWFGDERGRPAPGEIKLPDGVLISSSEVPHVRATSQTDPTEHLITHLKIDVKPADDPSVKGAARIVLKEASEEHLDKADKPVTPNKKADSQKSGDKAAVDPPAPTWLWAGLPVVAIAGLVGVAMRKRTPPAHS